jgi:beta-galactosidase/beta-glucuronidase
VLNTAKKLEVIPLVETSVEEAVPRPEYPRPQFVRREWLNLNGTWEFRVDDPNAGMVERWFDAAESAGVFRDRILVPFSIECAKSGIGDRAFHPCVWYRRTLRTPESWKSKRVLLHFGAVDYKATVWVNGTVVAWHEGGHTPFHCDISGQLQPGVNVLVVRAEDPPQDRYIPRGKQHWEEEPASIFYARTTGIWQTVWLEPVSESHLEHVRITPELDGTVTFAARISGAAHGQHVSVSIRFAGAQVAGGTSLADGPRAQVAARICGPKLWSPDEPNLYEATVELHGPEGVVDSIETYFGYRSVSSAGGKIQLNGHPLYLRTVLDQGYWPESNLTPPSDEAIQEDIRRTKELGFNGVRKHQKVEDPRYLYWADRLGLLVSAEMANAYLFNEDAVERMTREWMEVVRRDYNHPSIIIWVPVNESWGVPNLADERQQAHLKGLYYLTKSLDRTRLVIDNDGWEHTEVTDLFAIHDYTRTGEEFFRRFHNIPLAGVPLPRYGKLYLAPGFKYNGSPLFLSEFGGIGYITPEDKATVAENSWGYSGIEASPEAALQRMRGLYEAIAHIPQIAGICYTQLYDVEQEVNGLMTYDRRMKFDPAAIREINGLLS